jgi:hypothetical protein
MNHPAGRLTSCPAAKVLVGGFAVTGLVCQAVLPTSALDHAVIVAKYDGLAELLRRQHGSELRMTFEQLATAALGGAPAECLPAAAVVGQRGRRPTRSPRAWISAGRVVANVDLAGRAVAFRRWASNFQSRRTAHGGSLLLCWRTQSAAGSSTGLSWKVTA